MTQNNEWIEHDGNGCPATVAGKSGWLRTRDGYEVFRDFIQSDRRWIYSNTFTEKDNIIAYRLSETDRPEVDDHTQTILLGNDLLNHSPQPLNEAVAELILDPIMLPTMRAPLIDWKIDIMSLDVGTKLYTSPPSAQKLVDAAQAVVDRFESTRWKEPRTTETFIYNLRDAIEEYKKVK